MSRTFHHRIVRRSRKRHRCTWCAEGIEVGQPYHSYRWVSDGDAGTVHMHPECYSAMEQAAKDDPWGTWSPGDFARGSTQQPNSSEIPNS
jgi:hypothetical protein